MQIIFAPLSRHISPAGTDKGDSGKEKITPSSFKILWLHPSAQYPLPCTLHANLVVYDFDFGERNPGITMTLRVRTIGSFISLFFEMKFFSLHSVPGKPSEPNSAQHHPCYDVCGIPCDPVPLASTGAETKCVKAIGTGMAISPSFLAFIFLKGGVC